MVVTPDRNQAGQVTPDRVQVFGLAVLGIPDLIRWRRDPEHAGLLPFTKPPAKPAPAHLPGEDDRDQGQSPEEYF